MLTGHFSALTITAFVLDTLQLALQCPNETPATCFSAQLADWNAFRGGSLMKETSIAVCYNAQHMPHCPTTRVGTEYKTTFATRELCSTASNRCSGTCCSGFQKDMAYYGQSETSQWPTTANLRFKNFCPNSANLSG